MELQRLRDIKITRRHLLRLGAFSLASGIIEVTNVACSSENPLDYNDQNLILGGNAPWGQVAMYNIEGDCAKGDLPWGSGKLCLEDNKITGKSPWGKVNLAKEDGHIHGSMPWGKADLTFTATEVDGKIPWGDVDLVLENKILKGKLPWGNADLRLGVNYDRLDDLNVELALLTLLSDKT